MKSQNDVSENSGNVYNMDISIIERCSDFNDNVANCYVGRGYINDTFYERLFVKQARASDFPPSESDLVAKVKYDNEKEILSLLNHSHIPNYLGSDDSLNRNIIEYVRGETLLDKQEFLTAENKMSIYKAIREILNEMSEKGYVYNNNLSSNILVEFDSLGKMNDFYLHGFSNVKTIDDYKRQFPNASENQKQRAGLMNAYKKNNCSLGELELFLFSR